MRKIVFCFIFILIALTCIGSVCASDVNESSFDDVNVNVNDVKYFSY